MDSLLFWNGHALEANRLSHTFKLDPRTLGPTGSSRALAIFHLAIYDAYVRAKGTGITLSAYDSNTGNVTRPANVSVDGAISGAAARVLEKLYVATAQRPEFNVAVFATLAQFTFGPSDAAWDSSVAFGKSIADIILANRQSDPDGSDLNYDSVAPKGRAQHQKDPNDPGQGYHAPYYGCNSTLFAATKRHAIQTPPQPGSTETYL